MKNDFRRYTVWGENAAELELAADKVDAYMNGGKGRNIIYYQIIGAETPLPYDCGFITDAALEELGLGFIVVEQKAA